MSVIVAAVAVVPIALGAYQARQQRQQRKKRGGENDHSEHEGRSERGPTYGEPEPEPKPEPEPEPEQAPDHKMATETTKNPVARNCDDPNKPMRSKFEEPSTTIV